MIEEKQSTNTIRFLGAGREEQRSTQSVGQKLDHSLGENRRDGKGAKIEGRLISAIISLTMVRIEIQC